MKKPKFTRLDLLREFYDAPLESLFPQDTVAAVRGCQPSTLERDRWAGQGIPFLRIGRSIFYKKGDVLDWLARHAAVRSTAEADALRVRAESLGRAGDAR